MQSILKRGCRAPPSRHPLRDIASTADAAHREPSGAGATCPARTAGTPSMSVDRVTHRRFQKTDRVQNLSAARHRTPDEYQMTPANIPLICCNVNKCWNRFPKKARFFNYYNHFLKLRICSILYIIPRSPIHAIRTNTHFRPLIDLPGLSANSPTDPGNLSTCSIR